VDLPALLIIVCTVVAVTTLVATLVLDGHPKDGAENARHERDRPPP
jgi:hypothetical protein